MSMYGSVSLRVDHICQTFSGLGYSAAGQTFLDESQMSKGAKGVKEGCIVLTIF